MNKKIKKYFSDFQYFYSFLGYRIIVSFILSMGVAIMDGLGLTMFLPLLEMVDGGVGSSDRLGNLGFLVYGIESLGLRLNLISVLGVMFLFFLLKGIFKFLEGYFKVLLQRYFMKEVRFSQLKLLANLDFKTFVKSDSGKIQNSVSGEVNKVLSAYNAYFFSIQGAVMILVYLVLAFTVNGQFTLLVIIGGSLSNLIYSKIFTRSKSISSKLTQSNHDFQGFLIQKVAFFKYLKATGTLNRYSIKLQEKVLEIEGYLKQIGLLNAFINAIREPLVIMVVVIVILIEVTILGGSLGLILLSLIFFYRALTYLMNLQSHWNTYISNYGSLENLKLFLLELSKGQEKKGGNQFNRFNNKIELNKVSFRYDTVFVLNNIELCISKNETIALIGESGSGKTTLVNMLAGLIDPIEGEMYIDDVNIKHLDKESFQKRIGYITQEPVVFDDTIFNNVTLWDEPTGDNIKKFHFALNKAALFDFVDGLPNKENTRLGNNGIMISGGQKQRVSIARELYKDIDILIMDEATSALDSETEHIIQENMQKLKGLYTIIIVAHRLATIRNADRIVLMSKGKIKSIAGFNQLINDSLEFKNMVARQEF